MADPVSGSIIAAELAPTVAASIPALASTTALAAPFAAEATAASLPGIVSQAAPFMASSPSLGVMPEFSPLAMSGNPMVSAMGNGINSSGFGQGILNSISGANKFMNQNPVTSQIGMQIAKNAFAPEQPMQMAPMGQVSRGQVQPMDYMSLLNPQQQTVIRPPQISLLG